MKDPPGLFVALRTMIINVIIAVVVVVVIVVVTVICVGVLVQLRLLI